LRAADPSKLTRNFSPGPTSLPRSVIEGVQADLLSVDGCGMSALELSHRSPEFLRILSNTKATLRRVFDVPDNYKIIFSQGGGHGQFAALPLNLCGPCGGEGAHETPPEAHYIVSGVWSQRAATEAAKFCDVKVVGRRGTLGDIRQGSNDGLVMEDESNPNPNPNPNPRYVYVCSNETTTGFELQSLGEVARFAAEHCGGAPLVVDASSDLGSKRVDWAHVGALFACTPKNLGHPGLTIVIAREDLIYGRAAQPICPGVLDWQVLDSSDSLWNTPPTFNIHVTGRVLEWMENEGGLEEMERRSAAKAEAVWSAIENSGGFYSTPSMAAQHRSRCNVPFDVCGGDVAATEEFLLQAHARNIVRLRLLFTQPLKLTYPNSTLAALAQQVGLRTMTPFGFGEYLRASLYNSVPVEYAQELAGFMTQFAAEHRHLKTLAEFEKAVERQQHLQILTHQQQPPIQRRMQSPRRQQQAMHFYTAADATEP
jgi:phosphoserine aminotransferase